MNSQEHFKHVTIDEFNAENQLEVTEDMDIDEFTDYLEENDLNCFYASYSPDDVTNAIEAEQETVHHLKLNYFCINGLYVAIH